MIKNFRLLSGGLKKTPTVFNIELERIDFSTDARYIAFTQDEAAISIGTSLNVVSVNKRGVTKSSSLKQVEGSNGSLFAVFNEAFDFTATLFFDSTGKCSSKEFKLKLNRLSRIADSHEYSVNVFGTATIHLHDIGHDEKKHFDVPVLREGVPANAILKLNVIKRGERDEYIPDDSSSVGSDISFMQKESLADRSHKGRVVGGILPAAGSPTFLHRPSDSDGMSAEISILKMHLDRAAADKESLALTCKDQVREIEALRSENTILRSMLADKEATIRELSVRTL